MKALGVEVKTYDSSVTDTAISTTWTLLDEPFFEIVQGDADDERVGNKVTVVSIGLHGILRTISTRGSTIRVMLVLDKACNFASAGIAFILDAAVNIYSFNDINNTKRFTKLMDKTIDVPVSGIAYTSGDVLAGGEASKSFQKYKNNLDIDVTYRTTTGAVTDLTTANLQLWVCADFLDVVKGTFRTRVRYTDV